MSFRQVKKVQDGEPWGREVAVKLNNALSGKINVVEEVTLDASVATTVLADPLIKPDSLIALMPMTANAAAALSGLYFDAPISGQVTINHANNAQVDKTFRYGVFG